MFKSYSVVLKLKCGEDANNIFSELEKQGCVVSINTRIVGIDTIFVNDGDREIDSMHNLAIICGRRVVVDFVKDCRRREIELSALTGRVIIADPELEGISLRMRVQVSHRK